MRIEAIERRRCDNFGEAELIVETEPRRLMPSAQPLPYMARPNDLSNIEAISSVLPGL